MVTERNFNSVFDYSSAFEYGPADINMKTSFSRHYYKSAFTYHAISVSSDEDIEKSSKETLPSLILRNIITFVLYLVAIISFPISFWLCIKRVHSLERIVLLRLGRLQPVKGPGFAFILPCVDKWTRVDLRPQNFTVTTPQLITADGGVVEAKTDIEYRVSDVLDYVLKLRQQDRTLRELGLACLTNIMSEKDQDDLDTKREVVSSNLKDELNHSVMNWGLEVISVYLHSIKVLKAPEPVDAIGKIMTALKAATGATEHSSAIFPFLAPPPPEECSSVQSNSTLNSDEGEEDCVETIKRFADVASKEGYVKDLAAKFRFEIVGRSTRIVLLSFEKGNITVLENAESSLNSDVQLMLSEDNLKDFLNGQVSPLEAYMDGKVMVTRDWSLLRSLSKVFDLCKSG